MVLGVTRLVVGQMMLVDNLIHSDLHPGNILVRLDPPANPFLRVAASALSAFGRQVLLRSPVDHKCTSLREDHASSARSVVPLSFSRVPAHVADADSLSGSPLRSMPKHQLDTIMYGSLSMTFLLLHQPPLQCRGTRRVTDCMQPLLQVPERWWQPRITLLDVGMATHLSSQDQANMVALFTALADLDGAEVARQTLAFSGPQQSCPDPQVCTLGF